MADGASAGWHPDPYHRHEHRYYDGTQWTNDVSDAGVQSTDDPSSGAPAVVPPAAVATQTRAVPQKRPVWPWVLGGIFLVMVVGIGGCAVFAGVVLNEAANEISDAQERHAISQSQYDAVQLGTPKTQVLAEFGKAPVTTSSFKSEADGAPNVDLSADCIYYWESGETFGNWYQFCFNAAGNLRLKTQS